MTTQLLRFFSEVMCFYFKFPQNHKSLTLKRGCFGGASIAKSCQLHLVDWFDEDSIAAGNGLQCDKFWLEAAMLL